MRKLIAVISGFDVVFFFLLLCPEAFCTRLNYHQYSLSSLYPSLEGSSQILSLSFESRSKNKVVYAQILSLSYGSHHDFIGYPIALRQGKKHQSKRLYQLCSWWVRPRVLKSSIHPTASLHGSFRKRSMSSESNSEF